jgi:hypothetical protein
MLGDRRISAVLCSTDLARSQEFYERKVGLILSYAGIAALLSLAFLALSRQPSELFPPGN